MLLGFNKAATAVLREMGIKLFVYIDDILIMAESETQGRCTY